MGENKTERVTVRVPPRLAAQLDEFRGRHRWSRSVAVLSILEEKLRAAEPGADGGSLPAPGAGQPESLRM